MNAESEITPILADIIARIPAWVGVENMQVKRIAGLTNTNYRVTVNGECFVLRVSGKNTQRLGINRQHEAAALKNAAAPELGPEVFAFLLPVGHLVTHWIEGRDWLPVPTLKILDWEFAGLDDIYYDLATVVYTRDSEVPIPPDLEKVMLGCYFGASVPQRIRRLNGMKYVLMLFTGMWGLAQHGMQLAGLIPAAEGFDYLEFAQYLFAHDIQELEAVAA